MANKIKIDNAVLKRQKRKDTIHRNSRKISCQILVVCEGEKTEPYYFKKFKIINHESFVYAVTCTGGKINTIGVVNKAIELRDKASQKYDSIWAVFDKDNFSNKNFNDAILKAKKNGINAAWSNEAFELWYLYHFNNRVTAMGREEYKKAISDAVNNSGKWRKKVPYKYEKNSPDNFAIMTSYGSQENAIEWARAKHNEYQNQNYATHNPCTTVYKLVEQLLNKDKKLINQVMEKMNST